MSQWIDFRVIKPQEETIAVVTNTKGGMHLVLAVYYPYLDLWQPLQLDVITGYTLEVTHYIPIPDAPQSG